MWDLIVLVPDYCVSFYFVHKITAVHKRRYRLKYWLKGLFNPNQDKNQIKQNLFEKGETCKAPHPQKEKNDTEGSYTLHHYPS